MAIKNSGLKNILAKAKFLAKIPLILAKRPLLACFCIFFVSLIFGGFLFYKYVILVQKIEPEISQKDFFIKDKLYQEVLKIWQEKDEKSRNADLKEYPNFFWLPTVEKKVEKKLTN